MISFRRSGVLMDARTTHVPPSGRQVDENARKCQLLPSPPLAEPRDAGKTPGSRSHAKNASLPCFQCHGPKSASRSMGPTQGRGGDPRSHALIEQDAPEDQGEAREIKHAEALAE
jgi:hypothetical protein